MKWLEDELELNALHNPGSRRGSGNEKAAITQRTALSAALGGRVEVTAMSTISGQSLPSVCDAQVIFLDISLVVTIFAIKYIDITLGKECSLGS